MNKNKEYRTYTLKEAARKIKVPPATIRQWEKDFKDILVIPRNKNNARYFTEAEIDLLNKIKALKKNNSSKEEILKQLAKDLHGDPLDAKSLPAETVLETEMYPETELVDKTLPQVAAIKKKTNLEDFLSAIEHYKQEFIRDIQEAVASKQAEVMEEIKKEISASSVHTIREISKSIQRANEKRRAELQNVSGKLLQTSEQTVRQFAGLAESLKTEVKRNYDQLSQKLLETTKSHAKENKNLYSKVNKTMSDAKNSINKTNLSLEEKHQLLLDKLNEIKQNTEEIQQREEIFQEMLRNFREAAAAKAEKKKWWQIWSK